jgi:CheY-like chemotaxis protein
MTETNLHTPSTSPPAHDIVVRTSALVRLAKAGFESKAVVGAALRAIEALEVSACVFHRLDGKQLDVVGARAKDPDMARRLTLICELAGQRVLIGRSAVTLHDLDAEFPGERLVFGAGVSTYIGVPMVGPDGDMAGIVSLLGERGRHFDEDDEAWLAVAGKLVAGALAYEALKAKIASHVCPVVAAAPVVEPAPAAEPEVVDTRPCVLVIDDDKGVNNLISRVLKEEGYRVESCFDGVEAVEKFDPSVHDVVVCDIAMPKMNGWQVAAALRSREQSLPIILVTGYGSGSWNHAFLQEQGVHAVLNKPLDFKQFFGVVSDALAAGDPNYRPRPVSRPQPGGRVVR